MKLLIFVVFLAVFAQDTNFGVEGATIPIPGITGPLLEALATLFYPVVNEVGGLLTGLDSTVGNLTTSVLGVVSDIVDNFLSLADGLFANAIESGRVIANCANRVDDLKLLKQKISDSVEGCRKNLDTQRASISSELKGHLDRGEGLISSLNKSFQNCLKGLFVLTCISQAQQSALKEIQEIVKTAESLGQRISLASDDVTECLNDAEENGRLLANQIYQEIQQCVSGAPKIG